MDDDFLGEKEAVPNHRCRLILNASTKDVLRSGDIFVKHSQLVSMISLQIATFYFLTSILVGSVGDIIKIYTEEKFGYIYLNNFGIDVKKVSHIAFSIRARNDAHVALSKFENNPGFETYEIVIGGWNNEKSVIRKCSQCRPMTSLDGPLLNDSEFKQFWVSWDEAKLRVGEGGAPHLNELMSWLDPDPHLVNYLAVSTGWGSNGTWVFNFVDGGWSAWVTWSECSTTCANGTRMRTRYCDNPPPIYGASCEGPAEELGPCNRGYCPVDGCWSEWTTWDACSVSCDHGKRKRSRSCDNPKPLYGGQPCDGDNEEVVSCYDRDCPERIRVGQTLTRLSTGFTRRESTVIDHPLRNIGHTPAILVT
ncbi:hypothetical protein LSH36_66g05034 [Paralvinella palmiformis]|uniref:Farnesoic acid O-methyl transferase domain-containing protein n=1 Tax=Paralvinella palmiformis TaxID=53620 RepID=A0AAD9K4N4_9ANNE|nr:hypothetical protein LSH36_66g05034 [Paralvinella palmiformis]